MKNQPSCGAGDARCAGAACPFTPAITGGAAVTGDLQPSTDITTNNIIHVSIQPPASQRPAANRTQPLSLPPQSLGGPVVACRLFPLGFPP